MWRGGTQAHFGWYRVVSTPSESACRVSKLANGPGRGPGEGVRFESQWRYFDGRRERFENRKKRNPEISGRIAGTGDPTMESSVGKWGCSLSSTRAKPSPGSRAQGHHGSLKKSILRGGGDIWARGGGSGMGPSGVARDLNRSTGVWMGLVSAIGNARIGGCRDLGLGRRYGVFN